jgi:uncharacterized Zn finger protein (UPF0148 family)
MARMTTKICPVCGLQFKGTDGKITCSNACRTAAVRMRQKGKKMEYALIAKTKGQKLPAPKPIRIKEQETLEDTSIIDPKKDASAPQDSPKIGLISPPEKTDIVKLEDIWAHNDRINKLIKEEKNKKMPAGMPPKRWGLQQSDIISELEKQLIK